MPLPALLAAATSAAGGIMKGIGAYSAAKGQIATLRANARLARIQGLEQQRAIQTQANINTEVGREELSTIRNTFSNRGIDITSGSPLLAATSKYAEQLDDRNESFRQGEIAKIKGENIAANLEHQANQTKKALPYTLFGAGVSTASNAMSSYMQAGGDFSFLKKDKDTTHAIPS